VGKNQEASWKEKEKMKKQISEASLLGPSKSLLALGGIKKSLDAPVKDIGNFIEVVKSLVEKDPQNKDLQDLLSQLNAIVAYVGGAGSDIFNLQAKLRQNRNITTKLDSSFEEKVVETIIRYVVRKVIKEQFDKSI